MRSAPEVLIIYWSLHQIGFERDGVYTPLWTLNVAAGSNKTNETIYHEPVDRSHTGKLSYVRLLQYLTAKLGYTLLFIMWHKSFFSVKNKNIDSRALVSTRITVLSSRDRWISRKVTYKHLVLFIGQSAYIPTIPSNITPLPNLVSKKVEKETFT